ncbi:branched-chain amino acid transport system substrate-binding protein [Nitrobacteraceae bacterium AZCC 2161]
MRSRILRTALKRYKVFVKLAIAKTKLSEAGGCVMKLIEWLGAILILGLVGSASISPAARAADDIVIGFAVALSGPVAAYDDNSAKMAQVFIDDVNVKGGLLGRRLRAVFADTKSDRAEGARAGLEVLRLGADVVIGTCDYDYGAAALTQSEKAGKIGIFLCAEDAKAGVAGVGPLTFTAGVAAQLEGASLAEWGYQKKGFRNAYVLLDDSIEYTKSVCSGFDWLFPKEGGKIVGRDTFRNDDVSIASQVTRLRAAISAGKVDVVMLCSYLPGGSSAIRQIRAAGIELPILASSAFDGTYWLGGVPHLTNFYVPVQASVYHDDPRPAIGELIARYKQMFKDGPVTQFAFPIYAFLQLWAKAVEQTGTVDAEKVVAALNTYHDEPSILGPRSFTEKLHIQVRSPFLIVSISNQIGEVVDSWRLSEPIPNDVLYRLKR